jgi:hypothetical protein
MMGAVPTPSALLRAGDSAASPTGSTLAELAFNGLPHSGQKTAVPRTDTPQAKHRRAISGSIKKVFSPQFSVLSFAFTQN